MEYPEGMLAKLHELRRLALYNLPLYWALTLAIDFLLQVPQNMVDEDIERVRKAIAQEEL